MNTMQKLHVTVTDEQKSLVNSVVESGRYASASEVVRDGLRLVEEREMLREAKLNQLRALIQEGLEGPSESWDIEEIKAFARTEFGNAEKGSGELSSSHGK